jgi:hypothetical protein
VFANDLRQRNGISRGYQSFHPHLFSPFLLDCSSSAPSSRWFKARRKLVILVHCTTSPTPKFRQINISLFPRKVFMRPRTTPLHCKTVYLTAYFKGSMFLRKKNCDYLFYLHVFIVTQEREDGGFPYNKAK